jgi:hypothetical protein
MKVMDIIQDNYKTLFQPEMRTTKRIVEKEIGEIKREMEEIEKEFCFLSPDFNYIEWSDEKAEGCYENLGKTLKYLKNSLNTINHRMAILN